MFQTLGHQRQEAASWPIGQWDGWWNSGVFPYIVPSSALSDLGITSTLASLERKNMPVFFLVEFSFPGSYSLRISICFGVSAGDRIKRKRQRLPRDAGMHRCWVSLRDVQSRRSTHLIRLWQSQHQVWGPWQVVAEVPWTEKGSPETHE